MFLSIGYSLPDSSCDISCFTETNPNLSLLISNNNQNRKAYTVSAFCLFRNSTYLNYFFGKLADLVSSIRGSIVHTRNLSLLLWHLLLKLLLDHGICNLRGQK